MVSIDLHTQDIKVSSSILVFSELYHQSMTLLFEDSKNYEPIPFGSNIKKYTIL